MNKKILFLTFILLPGTLFLSGCSINEIRDNIKGYLEGNPLAIDQAEKLKEQIIDYNPVFGDEEDREAVSPVAKEIEEMTRSALKAVFAEVKMVAGGDTDTTPFIMRYIAKRRINQDDGDALYQELLKQECRSKDDGLPKFYGGRNTVEMSVIKEVGGRSYIIAVVIDLSEQVIWVNVY